MKLRDQKRELRQKETKELVLELESLTKELFDMRFRAITEKVSNPARIGGLRREIARIKTLIREREIASATATTQES